MSTVEGGELLLGSELSDGNPAYKNSSSMKVSFKRKIDRLYA
jgi:hypothetical protein